MLLIVTNTNDPTTDFVVEKLKADNKPFRRLNTDLFLTETTHKIHFDGNYNLLISDRNGPLDLNTIKSVWYRRPELPKVSSQLSTPQAVNFAQVESQYVLKSIYDLLDDRVWVSRPWAIRKANSKLDQLRVATKLSFRVPESLCTNDPVEAEKFIRKHGKVIVKPFKNNVIEEGDGTSWFIYTAEVNEARIDQLRSVCFAPTFFQERIEKDYEVRVTVFGNKVFATKVDSQADKNLVTDWRKSPTNSMLWSETQIPKPVETACLELVKHYGLRFGAIDLAVKDDKYTFFEMNPNGQWAWQEIKLGIPMTEALFEALEL
ncbi:hypothetical protein A2572_01215 [Candidatus Collierbacteria bacterium RIFOXYD1_FULL_40_9]|uniref:ATP-grasp domain-containing protein n=1 Tax=Candidatus Collierbacteria bacterium RIFOXYD1_FULL_40_9 TaxID=1817731 RepID=A0A1F5FPC3_9BACT|nr:MAG: hypothetical protein A2572_01215 [Candidatus Collierbacteria bacterium RIFOXYD1_FULL_40_9]